MEEAKKAAKGYTPTIPAQKAGDAISAVGDRGIEQLMIDAGRLAERFGVTADEAVGLIGPYVIDEATALPELLAVAQMALSPERDSADGYHDWHERLKAAASAAIAKASGK